MSTRVTLGHQQRRSTWMTKFIGFYDTSALPIKQGDMIVIPAGTTVKSMHPSKDRKRYVTKRRHTVKVHHLMNGMSIAVHMRTEPDRRYHPEFANTYAEFDALRAMMRDLTGDDLALAMDWYQNMRIVISNPTVCWSGTGGYWCEVDINDLLADTNEKEAA